MAMISQTAEYALRAVVFTARHVGRLCSGREIAEATDVPRGYLTKVLQTLAAADVMVISRGPRGGYAISRDPAHISVLDVVAAIDATARITRCPLGNDEHMKLCPLHRRLDDLAARAEQAMRETSIADLLPVAVGAQRCPFPERPLA